MAHNLSKANCFTCDTSLPIVLDENGKFNPKDFKINQIESQVLCNILKLPSFPFEYLFPKTLFCKQCIMYIKRFEILELYLRKSHSVLLSKIGIICDTNQESPESAPPSTNLEVVDVDTQTRTNPSYNDSFKLYFRKQIFEALQAMPGKEMNFQGTSDWAEKSHWAKYLETKRTEREIFNSLMNLELSEQDSHPSPGDSLGDLTSKVHEWDKSPQGPHLSPKVVEDQEHDEPTSDTGFNK